MRHVDNCSPRMVKALTVFPPHRQPLFSTQRELCTTQVTVGEKCLLQPCSFICRGCERKNIAGGEFSGQEETRTCGELLNGGCKKGYRGHCKCLEVSLKYSDLCKCVGVSEQNSYIIQTLKTHRSTNTEQFCFNRVCHICAHSRTKQSSQVATYLLFVIGKDKGVGLSVRNECSADFTSLGYWA